MNEEFEGRWIKVTQTSPLIYPQQSVVSADSLRLKKPIFVCCISPWWLVWRCLKIEHYILCSKILKAYAEFLIDSAKSSQDLQLGSFHLATQLNRDLFLSIMCLWWYFCLNPNNKPCSVSLSVPSRSQRSTWAASQATSQPKRSCYYGASRR